jgi:hypothetical protein
MLSFYYSLLNENHFPFTQFFMKIEKLSWCCHGLSIFRLKSLSFQDLTILEKFKRLSKSIEIEEKSFL